MQEHEHSHILHSKALHILEQALYVLDDIMPSPPHQCCKPAKASKALAKSSGGSQTKWRVSELTGCTKPSVFACRAGLPRRFRMACVTACLHSMHSYTDHAQ